MVKKLYMGGEKEALTHLAFKFTRTNPRHYIDKLGGATSKSLYLLPFSSGCKFDCSSTTKLMRLHQHRYCGIGPSSPITQLCFAMASSVILWLGSVREKANHFRTHTTLWDQNLRDE